MLQTIRDMAIALAEIRKSKAVQKEKLASLKTVLEETAEYKALQVAQATGKEIESQEKSAYTQLTSLMLKHEKENSESKFEDIGSVQNWTEYEIADSIAKDWAIKKALPNLLKLNVVEIKKVAKTLNPDGVIIRESKKAKVNTDLSKLLPPKKE